MFRRDKKHKQGNTNKEQDKAFIQPKLKMGKAGDAYEVEADKMADKVVNNSSSDAAVQRKGNEEEVQQKSLASEVTPLVQKKEAADEEQPVQKMEEEEAVQSKEDEEVQKQEEEEAVQSKAEEEVQMMEEEESVQSKEDEEVQMMEEEEAVQSKQEEEVQAKESKGKINRASSVENRLRNGSGGQKLDRNTKQEMESGFGADFSNVNIHNDAEAQEMSNDIGAQAFTHGNDIYFNKGKYDPNSKDGKLLLAHELTHTIQQKGMVQRKIQRTIVNPNQTIFENARERRYHTRIYRMYLRVLRNINPNVQTATPAQIRQAEDITVSILSGRRWYRRGPVRRTANGINSANKSKTTGMYVRKNINTTRNVVLNNARLPQQVTMQADNVWRTINLDPNNQLTNMNGTVTFMIASDLGQPDILDIRYFRPNGTARTLSVRSDTSRNPSPLTVNQSAPITIPLQNMGSQIISYRARPILPSVTTPSGSVYVLTATVNGTATSQNIVIDSGINGISKDPTKSNPLNKNYQIE